MGKIFYLMGKSSSGKDSLFKKIKERIPELKNIILYTTRPIREGEQNGVEYHFEMKINFRNWKKKVVLLSSVLIRQNMEFGNTLRQTMDKLICRNIVIW